MSNEAGIEQTAINTIRTLAMDAVQQAGSGHPGTPMALAPVAYVLWNEVLRYDPASPDWPGRDRFVLSCGHASMLLYAVLHLAGVRQRDAEGRVTDELAVPLEHIRNFRQLHSRCPGHPEAGETTGVETTTGPLGQGIGNSVGMAAAGRWLASRMNRPGFELFDYNVYAMCSDGDLMEGVGSEAASLAGHLKLPNLCWIYDDNRITIEGETSLAFSEDVAARFASYGWQVQRVAVANDLAAVRRALAAFQDSDRPTLIIVRSHIAWGAPNKQDTHGAHGSPLGEDEIRLTKAAYGWPEDAKFRVPDKVIQHFQDGIGQRGAAAHRRWQDQFAAYRKEFPELAQQWGMIQSRDLPDGWDADIPQFDADAKGLATRVSGGKVLNALAKRIPWLIGGSADLAPSTMTLLDGDEMGHFAAENHGGRNFHLGIREHAMGAMLGGLVLSGPRAFGATFLVFSDYMRPSIRLAALMKLPVIYVFTHDSLGVGEDGPTHQPIEHLAALRAIPHLVILRPGDANEVAEAYRAILPLKDRPVALALSRQNLPTLDRAKYNSADGVARGAYIMADAPGGKPDVILMATGSELSVAATAYEQLTADGVTARLVSFPSWELFEDQPEAYRQEVLPPAVTARVAIEMGIPQGWEKYVGPAGCFLGIDHFGASAPGGQLAQEFGFTAARVVAAAKELLKR